MGKNTVIVATHDEARPLSADNGVYGLGEVVSEEHGRARIWYCHEGLDPLTAAAPTAARVLKKGALLRDHGDSQDQGQGEGGGVNLAWNFVTAVPAPPAPGTTIERGAVICSPEEDANNDVQCTYVDDANGFAIPAVNAIAQVTVVTTPAGLSTAQWGGAEVYDPTHANRTLGVFCGGGFWDIVSIDASDKMTLRWRGLAGARITWKSP